MMFVNPERTVYLQEPQVPAIRFSVREPSILANRFRETTPRDSHPFKTTMIPLKYE